jgi:hypothetical protein
MSETVTKFRYPVKTPTNANCIRKEPYKPAALRERLLLPFGRSRIFCFSHWSRGLWRFIYDKINFSPCFVSVVTSFFLLREQSVLGNARLWVLRETAGLSMERTAEWIGRERCVALVFCRQGSVVTSGTVRLSRHVARVGRREERWKETTWKTLVEMGDNIKICMKYVWRFCVDWTNVTQGRDVMCLCEQGNEHAGYVKCEAFCGWGTAGYSRTPRRGFRCVCVCVCIQGVPGGRDKTSGECSLC